MKSPDRADFVQESLTMLEPLLQLRHHREPRPGSAIDSAAELLAHEVRRLAPQAAAPGLRDLIARLTPDEQLAVRHRALYYASQDLVVLLAHRYVKGNVVAREEAVLYVLDRLHRDDFRRIAAFDPANGASFKTYIWQVISRLLIDFVRAHRADRRRRHEYASLDAHDGAAASVERRSAESAALEEQMREVVSAVLTEESADIGALQTLHDRLREHLHLTSRERLFLRAVFQYDMGIDEVRQLPGFRMEKGEAWRLYYRLLEELLESFKDAGALGALRGLLGASDPHLTVFIGDAEVSLAVTQVLCVKERDAGSADCHVHWQGDIASGLIRDSFTRLRKTLAPWFSAINPTTLIADDVLAAQHEHWRRDDASTLRIAGVPEEFRIGRSQQAALHRRFTAKRSAADSYKDTGADSHTRRRTLP